MKKFLEFLKEHEKTIYAVAVGAVCAVVGHRIGYSEGQVDELIRLTKINDHLKF